MVMENLEGYLYGIEKDFLTKNGRGNTMDVAKIAVAKIAVAHTLNS